MKVFPMMFFVFISERFKILLFYKLIPRERNYISLYIWIYCKEKKCKYYYDMFHWTWNETLFSCVLDFCIGSFHCIWRIWKRFSNSTKSWSVLFLSFVESWMWIQLNLIKFQKKNDMIWIVWCSNRVYYHDTSGIEQVWIFSWISEWTNFRYKPLRFIKFTI